MRCTQGLDENWELVVGYAARTLDPGARASFERHLKSCEACSNTVAVQEAVWDALDEWPAEAVSRDFNDRLQSRIAQRGRSWWRWTALEPRSWLPAMPVAAACALFGVAFWLNHPQRVEVVVTPSEVSRQSVPRDLSPQIDQLEHALDDMDMLGQLGAGSAPKKAGSASRI